ncbi:MAG: carbohydrate kinase family protein [Rhodocyclaceae bacterium]|nr:carbohydrate kinase family protein [Rhodocyclaceae bacterium]
MSVLICGSLAYDTIMVFPDRFREHILPDKLHMLNVAFLVPEMRREFGGTAGNIAYNLHGLGGDARIMATVGDDFGPYRERLQGLGLRTDHVRHVAGTYTAQAFITTDLDDNQITAFHPGAMNFSHQNTVLDARDVRLAVIAPDGRDGMFRHARELAEAGIPFVFDPGQGLPMFNGDELMQFIHDAQYLAVNDYEAQLLQQKTGQSLESLAREVRALVVTLGGKGSQIHTGDGVVEIPPVAPRAVVDPTGCGDAYRAGLLHGITEGMDWETTGRLASLLGSLKIAERGAQNHPVVRSDIEDAFREAFGRSLT